jgi:hypothetical protein
LMPEPVSALAPLRLHSRERREEEGIAMATQK